MVVTYLKAEVRRCQAFQDLEVVIREGETGLKK